MDARVQLPPLRRLLERHVTLKHGEQPVAHIPARQRATIRAQYGRHKQTKDAQLWVFRLQVLVDVLVRRPELVDVGRPLCRSAKKRGGE